MAWRAPAFRWLTIGALVAIVCAAPGTAQAAAGPRCYVDASAAAGGNGNTWAMAYRDLHLALADNDCTEIWVANGTYKPTSGSSQLVSFALKNNVGIYGVSMETREAKPTGMSATG